MVASRTHLLAALVAIAGLASTAWAPRAGATAIALPPAPQARIGVALAPSVDLEHAHLVYGLVGDAGVSPFVVALGDPAATPQSLSFPSRSDICLDRRCAYTVLAVEAGTQSVVVAMQPAGAADAAGRTFDSVFASGPREAEIAAALDPDTFDASVLEAFFLDKVGAVSGAGVSPFLPDLPVLDLGANPTPYPDCPNVGANPTPHPDCPGPSRLMAYSTANDVGAANAQVFSTAPEPSAALLLGLALAGLGVTRLRAAR